MMMTKPSDMSAPVAGGIAALIFGNDTAEAGDALRRHVFLELLQEALGSSLRLLPQVDAGRVSPKRFRGRTSYVSGMGYEDRKRRYRQQLGAAPKWVDLLPLEVGRRCLTLGMDCSVPLPTNIIDLFMLKKDWE